MNTEKLNFRFGIVALIIVVAALTRLLPHPPNFTPIGAMALFGAAYFMKRAWAIVIPIAALWVSDMVLNNVVYAAYYDSFVWAHSAFWWNCLAFGLIVGVGSILLKKVNMTRVIGASLTASVIFFLLSNLGVWASGLSPATCPPSVAGLFTCYEWALPFFGNQLMGDLIYSGVLFGAFEWAKANKPNLVMG